MTTIFWLNYTSFDSSISLLEQEMREITGISLPKDSEQQWAEEYLTVDGWWSRCIQSKYK